MKLVIFSALLAMGFAALDELYWLSIICYTIAGAMACQFIYLMFRNKTKRK